MWKFRTFVAAALALAALTSTARAARLDYKAPARCPSQKRFADEVTARLGFSPWSGEGATVHVQIGVEKDQFVGSLARDQANPRRFVADSCRKLTDLLVTATAVVVDRSDAPAPRSARPAPRQVARAEKAAPAPRAARKPAPAPVVYPDPAQTAATWAFAERNNHYQAGLIFVSMAGFGVTGNVPLGPGHVQASYARTTTESQFGDGVNAQVHAYYLYPVFYINEGSSWEVPIFAGGGLGYQMYSFDQDMGDDVNKTAVLPTLAGGMTIQFRRFPVEFLSQMAVTLVEAPLDGSHFSFNIAVRYVFGRD